MRRWDRFTVEELHIIRDRLDEYCDSHENTCEAEGFLIDEINDELGWRNER